ncbi:MAG: glucosamine-6-phosphate deaminase [Deltaproteobacteria bacterium]|nr:glucosamine-6-phosphate deaminase [Deltaproteobacteria bacterium]
MEIIIRDNPQDCARVAAKIVAKYLRGKKGPVLGLATGGTPEGLYRQLISLYRAKKISFKNSTTFNLDEYVGLTHSHPQSYHRYMKEHLFDFIDIPEDKINIPDGTACDLRQTCLDYEARIKASGGIDLQVLGIGRNGHIGFNEPMGSLSSRTWIKILTENTIKDNARFFEDAGKVPRHVITMGIGTIMEARHCMVMACGWKKSQAVKAMIEGPVTAKWPASALQFHKRTTVVLDEAAASLLFHKEHYGWVEKNLLEWQNYEMP